MSAAAEPWRLDATAALALIRTGSLSARALTDSCLDRIAARDGPLRAFAYLDPSGARRQADAVDRAGPGPDLCGLPVGIKDIIDTAEMPTAYGSARYAGHRPARDADCVGRLRQARAVLPGKTATTEFAGAQPAPTRHPLRDGVTPGGSSAGSAAAVADGMLPLAIGTQTAGSVIRPAAFCGIVGLKASFGLVPRDGVRLVAPSLDTLGTFGRTVADAALALAAVADRPDFAAVAPQRPRIGLSVALPWDAPSADALAAVEDAARLAAAAGATVQALPLTPAFEGAVSDQIAVMGAETGRSMAADLARGDHGLGPLTMAAGREGAAISPTREAAARAGLAEARERFDALFADVDVLLCPSAPGEAPDGLAGTGDPLHNRFGSAMGGPCVTLPAGSGRRGLPLGVQLMARRGGDATLIAAALWLEGLLGPRASLFRGA